VVLRALCEPVMWERLDPGMEKDGALFVVFKVQVLSVVEFGPVSSSILVS
jgi:hypothetical protein